MRGIFIIILFILIINVYQITAKDVLQGFPEEPEQKAQVDPAAEIRNEIARAVNAKGAISLTPAQWAMVAEKEELRNRIPGDQLPPDILKDNLPDGITTIQKGKLEPEQLAANLDKLGDISEGYNSENVKAAIKQKYPNSGEVIIILLMLCFLTLNKNYLSRVAQLRVIYPHHPSVAFFIC